MGLEERHHNFDVFHYFSLDFYLKYDQPLVLAPVKNQKTTLVFCFFFFAASQTQSLWQFKTKEGQTLLQVLSL